ncbi:MAG: GNAT family N-acetyltransferase [Leeuwenhoekiella sp.]
MSSYKIVRYDPKHKVQWDAFIATAKNTSFLFFREFIGYHNEKFDDYSILVFKDKKVIAALPAHRVDKKLYSHNGLTYGAFVLPEGISFKKVKSIFDMILAYLTENGFEEFILKLIPSFYMTEPAFEIQHLMINEGAVVTGSELNFAVDYFFRETISKNKLRHFRKNELLDFSIEKGDFRPFWRDILIPRLAEKFGSQPVHSLEEIELLHSHFPDNIQQYNLFKDEELLAGITVFISGMTAKSQYAATTAQGEKMRAMDQLYIFLIQKYKALGFKFFDLGTVKGGSEPYNFGLIKQKEELGGKAYLQKTIKLKL